VVDACKKVLWMKNFLQMLGMKQDNYNLFCNNQSFIHLAKNPSFHSQTKHIEVRYHWILKVASSKSLRLEKIHNDKNSSDMMTEILLSEKLLVCCKTVASQCPPHDSDGGECRVSSSCGL
jgi:hypothetical protein